MQSFKLYETLTYFSFYITGCVSFSDFASLVGIPIGILNFAVGLKICVVTAGIRKYKSIIGKYKKKHDKIVLLAKSKLSNTKC